MSQMNLAARLRNETVFILGAGASVPYNYPTGTELVRQIVKGKLPAKSALKGHKDFDDFRANLAGAKARSVDIFLSRDKHRRFEAVGKLAIAEQLILCEHHDKIFAPQIEDDWYEYVFNTVLEHTTDLIEVANIPLAFITFNYDRSLEHFLYTFLRSNFPNNTTNEVIAVIDKINIIHVYGCLGPLEWQDPSGRPYSSLISKAIVKEAANNILIMHEGTRDSDAFKFARALLEVADNIMFLGFGYHSANMERLAVPFNRLGGHAGNSGITPIRQIWGIAYGMTDEEAIHTANRFHRPWALRGCQKTGNDNRLTAARDLRPAMTGPCPFHKENCHGGRLYAGGVF